MRFEWLWDGFLKEKLDVGCAEVWVVWMIQRIQRIWNGYICKSRYIPLVFKTKCPLVLLKLYWLGFIKDQNCSLRYNLIELVIFRINSFNFLIKTVYACNVEMSQSPILVYDSKLVLLHARKALQCLNLVESHSIGDRIEKILFVLLR